MSHKAEPNESVVKERKRGAVADHKTLSNTVVKQGVGVDTLFFYAHQHKIGRWLIDLDGIPTGQQIVEAAAFRTD